MPFVIPAVAAAVGAAASGFAIAGSTVLGALAVFGVNVALSGLAAALKKEPKRAELSSLARSSRTLNIREPVAARRAIYGQAKVGGAVVYIATAQFRKPRDTLLIALALAGHEVAAVERFWFDDVELTSFQASNGTPGATKAPSRYKDRAFVYTHLGTATQVVDEALNLAKPSEWTTAHRLQGIAYLGLKLIQRENENIYSALPQITAFVKGKKVFDPRDSQTRWTQNPALALRDHLLDATLGLGVAAAEIESAELIAAANLCEEMAAVKQAADGFTADPATDVLTRSTTNARLIVGDAVNLSTTGSLPGGLAAGVDYYVMPIDDSRFKLAATLLNAYDGLAINVSSAGSGSHTATRVKEPRYTLNGTFDSDEPESEIIEKMLSAMDGKLVRSGGKWLIRAGQYAAPTVTLDEGDLRGPIEVGTKIPRRDRFNALKGVYISPDNDWQASDFPPLTDATAEANDGGRIYKDIELPFTISAGMAQRLAKIALKKGRAEKTVRYPAKLTALAVIASDTVAITNARMGWSAKPFWIEDWRLTVEDDEGGAPVLGVDLNLREAASSIYDWNAGTEEVLSELKAFSDLGDALSEVPSDVTGFSVVQEAIVNNFKWNPVPDNFIDGYVIKFGPRGATSWDDATPVSEVTRGTSITNATVPPGDWTCFIKAVNAFTLNGEAQRNESVNAASYDAVIERTGDALEDTDQAPGWPGTFDGLNKHWTGVLMHQSKDLAGAANDFTTFDTVVPNPTVLGTYEAPEQDVGFDDTVRVFGDIRSSLVIGQTSGVANPQAQIDYRLAASSYDGFEPWSLGSITARKIKQRFVNDSGVGLAKITGFIPDVDRDERTESGTNVVIAVGGTAITFATPFHSSPLITATPQGSAARIAVITAKSTAGFSVKVFDAAGTDVGGTVDWEARGV